MKRKIGIGLMVGLIAGTCILSSTAMAYSEDVLWEEDDMLEEYVSFEDLIDMTPTWSEEYLMKYLEEKGPDLGKWVKKTKEIQKKCAKLENRVFLKENAKIFGENYYSMTKEASDICYWGDIKDGRPHGLGIIGRWFEDEFYGEMSIFQVEYMGEFEKGVYSGEGIQYEGGELNDEEISVLRDLENPDNGQELFDKFCNPLVHMGEFKNGKWNGEGVTFIYPSNIELLGYIHYGMSLSELPNLNDDLIIVQGNFKNGEEKINGKIYYIDKLSYEGEMKENLPHGKGKLYYFETGKLKYEGEFKDGLYDGRGTEYTEDGKISYEGQWQQGDYKN